MAEQIVSAGVFTNENDLSFLPTGIAQIGAAIVGPTLKGPAFIPTVLNNFDDFIKVFGDVYEESYVPYAVRNYIRNAANVTVVRVLTNTGYSFDNYAAIVLSGSFSTAQVTVGAILPTTIVGSSTGKSFTSASITPALASFTGSFALTLSGSGIIAENLSASAQPTNNISLGNVLGESAKGAKKGYMYILFDSYLASTSLTGSGAAFVTMNTGSSVNLSGSTYGAYGPAATPWVTSQLITGQSPAQLFKVYTIGDGNDTNTSVKVSVINLQKPGTLPNTDYGTFTLLVRDYNDTDQRPVVLETFTNLTLDPASTDYIGRRIGDRYFTVNSDFDLVTNGNYNNNSKYIRVDMDANVDNGSASPSYYPAGFESILQPIVVPFPLPTMSLVTQLTEINGSYSKKAYYGNNYTNTDNENYFKPLAQNAAAGNNSRFNLDSCFVHPSASGVNAGIVGGLSLSSSLFEGVDVSTFLKFSVPFQAGFDGADPAVPKYVGSSITSANLFGFDLTSTSTGGGAAYVKALNVLQNADQFDINMLVAPGVTLQKHLGVANQMVETAEDRGDTFVIIDPVVQNSTLSEAVNAVADSGLDTSYTATYWPWVKMLDPNTAKPIWVPPSVVVPQVIAFNDSVAYEWFAPAGLNRGGISTAIDVEIKLSQSKRDTLYQNRINPIATFPNQGICIWGQKTLQVRTSALDRINVRRLLIALKKYIASASRYLVFENNTTQTRQKFLNIVNPYLETVKQRQGLYTFNVVMDETNNTPDVIDRNIMYGQIYIQPAKTAEFIILDFNVLPTGASFDNV
jgi:hypothetical protein